MPVKPPTQRETIDALWYAVVGTNGDGIQGRLRALETRPRNRWLLLKDIVLVVVPLTMLARVLGMI